MKVGVLIVDDEPLARQRIRRFLAERNDVDVVGECAGGRAAVAAIVRLEPALVLLDIRMPDLDGFGVIAALGGRRLPSIVFITAYQQHAIRAFEVDACDYLLKPFDRTRFHQAIDRALLRTRDAAADEARLRAMWRVLRAQAERDAAATGTGTSATTPGRPESGVTAAQSSTRVPDARDVRTNPVPAPVYVDRLVIHAARRVRLQPVAEIEVLEASDNYVIVHTATGQYRMRSTLQQVEDRLDPARFVRVHRSYVVRASAIVEVERWVAGDAVLVMQSGRRVRLSRTHRPAFEQLTSLGGGT